MIPAHLYLRWGYAMEFNSCGAHVIQLLGLSSELTCSLLLSLLAATSVQTPLRCRRDCRVPCKAGIWDNASWMLMKSENHLGSQNLLKYARRLSGTSVLPKGQYNADLKCQPIKLSCCCPCSETTTSCGFTRSWLCFPVTSTSSKTET